MSVTYVAGIFYWQFFSSQNCLTKSLRGPIRPDDELFEFFELFEKYTQFTTIHTTLVQFGMVSMCTKNGIYYCAIFIIKKYCIL